MKIGRFFLALVIGLFLILGGCGGGGSGVSSTFQLVTDWTNYKGASGGQSVRVQLFTPTGALAQSQIINYSGSNQSSQPFLGLTAGSYHIEAQLFSQTNAQGVQVGELDSTFDPTQIHSLTLAVGGLVSTIQVTPVAAVLNVQTTQFFYASGVTSNGSLTFLASGSIVWSTLGSVGTIDQTGLFTGTTPGSGSVRASYTPSGLVAGATVTVNQINVTKETWTIMVYMNAANDLSQYSLTNFEQMQEVASNPHVRIIVQWKQAPSLGYSTAFDGTRRYLMQHSTAQSIDSQLIQDLGTGVDMGSSTTMNNFVTWASTYYPADHYAIVVWDHGNGWNRGHTAAASRAVSYDDETGNSIQAWQLSQALGSTHFDILGWDASLMQMAEVSDEIRTQVTYIAGSEESPPGQGYPYNLIFAPFTANPNATPLSLAKGFVDGMIQFYAADPTSKITQSVIDTSQLPNLMATIKSLGTALQSGVGTPNFATSIQAARVNTQSYSPTSIRFYVDLYDLTLKLDSSAGMPASVITADAAVRQAVTSTIVYEGHNAESPNSHGISIDFSPGSVFTSETTDYSNLRMEADTFWGNWLLVAP